MSDRRGAWAHVEKHGEREFSAIVQAMSDEALGVMMRDLESKLDAGRKYVFDPSNPKRVPVSNEVRKLYTCARLEYWTRNGGVTPVAGDKCTRGDMEALRDVPKMSILKPRYSNAPVDHTVTHQPRPAPQATPAWPDATAQPQPKTLDELHDEFMACVDMLILAEQREDEIRARELADELQIRAIVI